jgi:hypothetical protein
VANAKAAFPSHSGIVFFVKVGLEDYYIPFILKLTIILCTKIDDLLVCNACDAEGVPDLVRSSGRHTEDHHLIRCLAPENAADKALPAEQRLTSIEGRLDGMQTQLDDITTRMGNIEQLLHRLLAAGTPRNAA